ncbi:MAG: TULIP family P47-like protein [Bacteroidota bacterium]
MPTDNILIQAYDKPISFQLPELDAHLERLNQGGAHPSAAAFLAAASTVPIANTEGWDTIYAIRVPDVNQAIAQQKTSPTSFNNTTKDPKFGLNTTIDGSFGDWQITLRGGGQNVNMAVPVSKGTFTLNGVENKLDGLKVIIQIKMQYYPEMPLSLQPPSATGTEHQLKVKLTSDIPEIPVVSVLNLVWPEGVPDPGGIEDALIEANFQDWFNKHLQDFDQVFAAVKLNLRADKNHLKWLKPTHTSYAYSEIPNTTNLCDAIFGVLCITTSKVDPKTLSQNIPSGAIPKGERSAFLIGRQLFTREAMFTGLPNAFQKGTAKDNFELIDNDTAITLSAKAKNKDVIALDNVKYAGTTYHPFLHNLDVQVNEAEIITTMTVKIQISPGINAFLDIINYHGLQLEKNSNGGTQTLGFIQTRDAKCSHRTVTDPGVIAGEAIAGLIVSVIGLFVGKAAKETAKRIIIAIIVAVIAGIITAIQLIITDVIAKGVENAMPPFDPIIKEGTDPIVWPTATSQFTLTAATLNGSVQISGVPEFIGPNPCSNS